MQQSYLQGSISIIQQHSVVAGQLPVYNFDDISRIITNKEWSPAKFEAAKRNKAAVTTVDFMVYDIDANHSLESILQHFKASGWKHQVSATRNHMKLKNGVIGPRVRVVVPFNRPVTAEEYTALHTVTTASFPVDSACKDACHYFYPSTSVLHTEVDGAYMLVDDLLQLWRPAKFFAASNANLPFDATSRGRLANRTLQFLQYWPVIKEHRTWHKEFIFAVRDLASQNYSYDEAKQFLTAITGHLDATDLKQLNDRWECDRFKFDFRTPKQGAY